MAYVWNYCVVLLESLGDLVLVLDFRGESSYILLDHFNSVYYHIFENPLTDHHVLMVIIRLDRFHLEILWVQCPQLDTPLL